MRLDFGIESENFSVKQLYILVKFIERIFLFSVFVFGMFIFSCGESEKVSELEKKATELEAQIAELQKKNAELRELGLPQLPQFHDEFLDLCKRLGI